MKLLLFSDLHADREAARALCALAAQADAVKNAVYSSLHLRGIRSHLSLGVLESWW